MQEWGSTPITPKRFHYEGKSYSDKHIAEYDYLDSVDAFNNVLLYENLEHKHFWFITIELEDHNTALPSWFIKWWQHFGPGNKIRRILPETFTRLFLEWKESSSPSYLKYQAKAKDVYSLLFFATFSIPYIWRWEPAFGYIYMFNAFLPSLKRRSYSKFRGKIKLNPTSKKLEDHLRICHVNPIKGAYLEESSQTKNKIT